MLRHLKLDRPLAVIDTETTGLPGDDPRLVEIAIVRVQPDLSIDALVRRIHPGIPIPPAASAVHGIRDDQVTTCPRFGDVAGWVVGFMAGCDLAGFNLVGFDLEVLGAELRRAELPPLDLAGRRVLDVMGLFWEHALTLNAYGLPARGTGTLAAACHRYLREVASHGALLDALATLRVLDAMIPVHSLPARFAELAAPSLVTGHSSLVCDGETKDSSIATSAAADLRTRPDPAASRPDLPITKQMTNDQ